MIDILLIFSYTIYTINMVLTSVWMFYKFHQVISMQSPCQVGCGIRLSDAIASSTHLSWGQWKPWQNHWWKSFVVHAGHNFWMFRIFLAATKQLYEWYFLSVCPSVRLSVRLSVCPSVCLSVCPSVRLSHLFDYVPIIVSSWNFQELSHWPRVRSMQKVKVRGQRSRSQRSRPKFSFPDCNSSLNSHMMMKWYI